MQATREELIEMLRMDRERIAELEDERDALAAHVEAITYLGKVMRQEENDEQAAVLAEWFDKALERSPETSLAKRDARAAAEAIERWRQDRADLIHELSCCQRMLHLLARSGECSPEYPNDARVVLERVTGGKAPDFTDTRADEIAAGGGQ